jgi:hypothetical protein
MAEISRNFECKLVYGSVLMVLLVIAGVQVNLGPPLEQNKTDQILTLGPYQWKNCLWLPTTSCKKNAGTDSLMGLEFASCKMQQNCVTLPQTIKNLHMRQDLNKVRPL